MAGPLFDQYLVIDWSAANAPTIGRDSIWLAFAGRDQANLLENIATRHEAMTRVREILVEAIAKQRRTLVCLDFAFGFPAGAARRIGGDADWGSLWSRLAELIDDGDDNRSNSFDVGAHINVTSFPETDAGPFWGHPHQHGGRYAGLLPVKGTAVFGDVEPFRLVEGRAKGAKSVFQLAYNGAVGRQSLLGIARLQELRTDDRLAGKIAVWPFETGFADDLSKPVVVAEIYPSFFNVRRDAHPVLDAAQVLSVAEDILSLDRAGELATLLSCPANLLGADREKVLREEGWILGVDTYLPKASPAPGPSPKPAGSRSVGDYVRDPAEIYRQSFATIRREAALGRFAAPLADVVIRLIHACGMTDLADDIVASDDLVEAGRAALLSGAPVICDVEMVRHGVISRLLPKANPVLCLLGDPRVAELARHNETTRSAAQVELWAERMAGAVIAIGNAPTALFRLLELIDAGAAKPAVILGLPVGFVGAAESKDALIAQSRGVPYLTVRGRRGGSAMASAAVNALAAGLEGHG